MLNISNKVFDAFSQNSEKNFEKRLVGALSPSIPAIKKVPAPQLHAWIWSQISRARSYGFVTEQDFGIYLIAAWFLGPDFDVRFKPPQFVLGSRAYSRDEKREWLLTWSYEIFAESAREMGSGDRLKPLAD